MFKIKKLRLPFCATDKATAQSTQLLQWLRQWLGDLDSAWATLPCQSATFAEDRPLQTIFVDGLGGFLVLGVLVALAHQRATKSGESINRHLIIAQSQWITPAQWQQLSALASQAGMGELAAAYTVIGQQWPLALPGRHRIEITDNNNVGSNSNNGSRGDNDGKANRGSLTIHLGLGDLDHMQRQWRCSVDVYLRARCAVLEDVESAPVPWPWVLRYAASQCAILAESSPSAHGSMGATDALSANHVAADDGRTETAAQGVDQELQEALKQLGMRWQVDWPVLPMRHQAPGQELGQGQGQGQAQGQKHHRAQQRVPEQAQAQDQEPLRRIRASRYQRGSEAATGAAPSRTVTTNTSHQSDKRVVIIGGGIAGAGIAHVMQLKGWEVTVIDPAFEQSLACLHHDHRAAAMTPFVSLDDNYKARLSRHAMLRTQHYWQAFPEDVILSRSGTVEVNRSQGYGKQLTEAVKQLAFPEAWVEYLDANAMSAALGMSFEEAGVIWHSAWVVSPQQLLRHIYTEFPIQRQATTVHRLEAQGNDWRVIDKAGQLVAQTPYVVLANAAGSVDILSQSQLLQRKNVSGHWVPALAKIAQSMHWMGGQVMYVPTAEFDQVPKRALGGQGYVLPPSQTLLAQTTPSQRAYCVLGSTYEHGIQSPAINAQAQAQILQKIPLPSQAKASLRSVLGSEESCYPGWSGARAVIQGRLPVIAPLAHAPGLWLAAGYGSHGLTWSGFAGELIAASLASGPLTLEKELLQAIGLR